MRHDQLAKTLIATFFASPDSAKDVLLHWIDTYVQLAGEDAAEYRRLLALEKNKEVRRMEQTWMGRAEEQGFKKGKAVGLEKGKTQGFRKGKMEGKAEAVDRMRRMVLQQIERRFGAVTEPVETRIREITSIETLVRLFAKVPSLESPEDLLPRRNGKAKSTD
jgi:hypothetical protein